MTVHKEGEERQWDGRKVLGHKTTIHIFQNSMLKYNFLSNIHIVVSLSLSDSDIKLASYRAAVKFVLQSLRGGLTITK